MTTKAYGFTVYALLASAAFAGPSVAEPLTLRADDCKRVTQHVPAKDVEYKAGVDVHGKAVASADLGGGYPTMMPDEITIQIGVDLADRLARARAKQQGNATPTTGSRPILGYEGKVPIGTVTVKGNTVLWNDQPLAPQDEAALAAACRASQAAAEPPPPKPAPPKPAAKP